MIQSKLEGQDILAVNLLSIRNPEIRKKAIEAVSIQVRKNSVKRARDQRNVDGSKFIKHAKGRKRKLLTRLALRLRVHDLTALGAFVGWKNRTEENIASKQHFGFKQRFTTDSFKKQQRGKGESSRFDDATRKQGKALIAAGYRVKRQNGKGLAPPTIRWITENLTINRAGLILRILRGNQTKEEWETTLPERQFLGVEIREIPALQKIISNVIKQNLELK